MPEQLEPFLVSALKQLATIRIKLSVRHCTGQKLTDQRQIAVDATLQRTAKRVLSTYHVHCYCSEAPQKVNPCLSLASDVQHQRIPQHSTNLLVKTRGAV